MDNSCKESLPAVNNDNEMLGFAEMGLTSRAVDSSHGRHLLYGVQQGPC